MLAPSVRHQPVLFYQNGEKKITQTTPYASQGLRFSGAKDLGEILIGSLLTEGGKYKWSRKIAIFHK